MAPETSPRATHCPPPCTIKGDCGIDPAVLPETATTNVPVAGWRRGTTSTSANASRATPAATAQRTRGLGSSTPTYGVPALLVRGVAPYLAATRSMNATHMSATAALSIWVTFSAFCSPLCDRLKLPV